MEREPEPGYIATPEPILQALAPIQRGDAREDYYAELMIRYYLTLRRRWRTAVEAYWDDVNTDGG